MSSTETTRKQYDPARAAYLRSRKLEKWVGGYVDKMNAWPAPRFVRSVEYQELVESVGMKRAAMMMGEVEDERKQ